MQINIRGNYTYLSLTHYKVMGKVMISFMTSSFHSRMENPSAYMYMINLFLSCTMTGDETYESQKQEMSFVLL